MTDDERHTKYLARLRSNDALAADEQLWCVERWAERPSEHLRLTLLIYAIQPSLLRLLRYYGADVASAEDAIQDLWMAVASDGQRFLIPGAPARATLNTLLKAALRKWLDLTRKDRRHERRAANWSVEAPTQEPGPDAALEHTDDDVRQFLRARLGERFSVIEAVLDERSTRGTRTDWKAIGFRMGIEPTTARQRFYRVRDEARALLEEEGFGG